MTFMWIGSTARIYFKMPFSNKAKSERLSLSLYNFRIEQMHRIDFECVNKHCVYSRIARVFGAQQCDVRCDMLHGWSCESHVAKQNSVSHNHFPFNSSFCLLSRNLCNAKVAMWRNASSFVRYIETCIISCCLWIFQLWVFSLMDHNRIFVHANLRVKLGLSENEFHVVFICVLVFPF